VRKLIADIVRSPLVHFVVIGAGLFVLYGLYGEPSAEDADNTIVVSSGEIGWLRDSFSKRWNRPPTPQELKGLIDTHVRETVLYREAVAMGLDDGDVIIRRRLAQKLEFLFQDLADAREPTEQELRDFFAAHREQYRDPEISTFTHVFVDPDRRGENTLADAEKILAELDALADPTEAAADRGDRFMLQAYYPERSEAEVARLFGQAFARSVFELVPGRWHGPVLSGYGVHLVYVHGRSQSPPPSFDDVRDLVARDWQDKVRQEFNDQYVENLTSRYDIIIEDESSEPVVSAR
jgi:hypothetical protein